MKKCTYNRLLLADKHTIANSKILNQISIRVDIVADLEVLASMSFSSLLILVGNHEIVDNFFL